MTRKAMVLAAGLGTRMRPLTDTLPKPLISVGGKTLLDHALDWLAEGGVAEAVVNTHYKANMIERHLKERTSPRIHISHEAEILETGGGIKKALPVLGEEAFFSVNSDTICLNGSEHVIKRLENAWQEVAMDTLLLLHPVEKAVGYYGAGDFFLENGKPRRRMKEEKAPLVFTGVQLLHPRLFTDAPDGAFSLNVLYNRAMAPDGSLARVGALVHDGNWLHVGDPKGLAEAEAFLNA